MPANDLTLLTDAARAAAETATRYIGGNLNVTQKPDDSPVTAADLAVNAVLSDMLRSARPHYGWLSEESPDDAARLDNEHTFIIDPIDGTRSFIAGEDTWAHSLAIARNGQITAAVVYLPLRDKLYSADLGRGSSLNGKPITVAAPTTLSDAHILTTKPNLDPHHWHGDVPDFRRSHRPSLAYRLSLVAEGAYDAMFTLRPSWEWDIAAGALILTEAGARVSDKTGADLRFNNPHPQVNGVVAGAEAVWAEVLSGLRS
ncbi:inositol monophosphatase family protein [Puniceibacterium sediminis]|uniref:Myo-inositol-1(Or 4)-monophosphatase n=1 Tax=Puniceibacterium sediminis TaxID=1608407 RepID=A0A238Z7G5_9RHOB|nr:3'(2'),5'-bisphosphate nucleotidase CysQ [Puniceibacterium sediminis]SNR79337.1 myo-inositol-1(or 4)-monophosphatase [Puniceibacterium sediminis]